jgi:hypothetical protein
MVMAKHFFGPRIGQHLKILNSLQVFLSPTLRVKYDSKLTPYQFFVQNVAIYKPRQTWLRLLSKWADKSKIAI